MRELLDHRRLCKQKPPQHTKHNSTPVNFVGPPPQIHPIYKQHTASSRPAGPPLTPPVSTPPSTPPILPEPLLQYTTDKQKQQDAQYEATRNIQNG